MVEQGGENRPIALALEGARVGSIQKQEEQKNLLFH